MFCTPAGLGLVNPAFAASTPYINNVQYVEITIGASQTSNTATITSVDTSKTWLVYNGHTDSNGTEDMTQNVVAISLTNATTVTALRQAQDGTNAITVRISVVEGNSNLIQSVQSGTITFAKTATTGTATITSVTTGNAFVVHQGSTDNATLLPAPDNPAFSSFTLELTAATTVTATRNSATNATATVYYVVVEFKSGVLASNQKRVITIPWIRLPFTPTQAPTGSILSS